MVINNKITDKGLKNFAENGSNFPKLQLLNLNSNKIIK